jgi:hypothetical protein
LFAGLPIGETDLKERLFDGAFHVMGVKFAPFGRDWIEMDLREERQATRRSPHVKENSRQISCEHFTRQFKLIRILPRDFVNQSQSLAFSETRITNY